MSTFVEIMSQTSKPAPYVDSVLDEQFWAHCAKQQLCFQRCDSCGTWRHLPRHLCAKCGSPTWQWQASSGEGEIFSWTVVHLPMHPAFAKDVPYTVGIIEMAEGVRMVARLNGFAADTLRLGAPVEVYFEPREDAPVLPLFRPRTTP